MVNKWYLIVIIFCLLLNACERGKPLNMEADILNVYLYDGDNDDLIGYKMNILDDNISFFIPTMNDYSKIKPIIEISKGATITPPSGQVYDFTNGMDFKVISQDSKWQRVYTITIDSAALWSFDFEEWTNVTVGNLSYLEPVGWTSANKAVVMLCEPLGIDFPTYRTTDAYSGDYALEMCTRFGSLNGGIIPPIISGSAFIGKFNTQNIMTDRLSCAEFGVPFSYNGINKPYKMTAKIKYKPGTTFVDENGNIITGKVDKFVFYAVFFWGRESLTYRNLDNNDRVIAKAVLDNNIEYTNYTPVEIYFDYDSYGGNIPLNEELQLSIIASSSYEGDYYRGAVGSMLTIDDVEIIFE